MSSSIAKLEEYLGGRLFLRNPRGTLPTAFGDVILPRVNQVVVDLERVETEARAFTERGHGKIRVGTSPQIEKVLVTRLRELVYGPETYSPETPGRDATLFESELDQLEEYLRGGMLDVIMVPAHGLLPAYSHRLINSDYLVLVETEGSSDTSGEREPVTVRELAEQELILARNGCGITRTVHSLLDEGGAVPGAVGGRGRQLFHPAQLGGQGDGFDPAAGAQRHPGAGLPQDPPGGRHLRGDVQ